MKPILIFTIALLLACSLQAQDGLIPFNETFSNRIEHVVLNKGNRSFSSSKPLRKNDFAFDTDSVLYLKPRGPKIISRLKHPIWWKKLRTDHLIEYRKDDFYLTVDPRINLSKSSYDHDYFMTQNSRGVEINGSIGKTFSFGSGFSENQVFFPEYISNFIKIRRALPGLGRASKAFKETAYDFSEAYGWVSFTPIDFLNLQIGHGKQFIGDGYRSLIQSQNSFNIPFAKITASFGPFRYMNLTQVFQELSLADATTEIERRRYNSTHVLGYLIGNNFEISLIESIVFAPKRKDNYFPNINLFNPITGFRTIQYGYKSKQNILSSINLRYDAFKAVRFYSQFAFNGNKKYGFQIGAKSYRLFNIPLTTQIEYNRVQPFMYSHHATQSFTNSNQELAHPLGANFDEIIFKVNYHWKDFYINYQYNHARIGTSTSDLISGCDILTPYKEMNPNTFLQGNLTNISNHTLDVSYLINPVTNLSVFMTYRQRILEIKDNPIKESFYVIGIRTSIYSYYTDF